MTPSADCAAAKAAAGKVVPSWRNARSPIDAGVNARPNPKIRSAARRTSTVAALISGPMPSPSMTTSRVTARPPGIACPQIVDLAPCRSQPPRPACGERVGARGRLRESERVERPPHPNLLPACGEKERTLRACIQKSGASPHALSDLLGAPRRLGHEEADIGLGGDEADALADEGELALEVALAAEAGKLAMPAGGRDCALHCRGHFRIAERAGLAQGGKEIVASHMDDV